MQASPSEVMDDVLRGLGVDERPAVFTPHLELVQRIQSLLRDDKYTIEGARQVLEREAEGGEDLRSALADIPREQLVDLRAFLADVLRGLGPGR